MSYPRVAGATITFPSAVGRIKCHSRSMSRLAIVASLALHAGLFLLAGWLSPSTRIGAGHSGTDASFFAGDAAGPLVSVSAPSSEPASEPELAAPEFIPPTPVVVPSAPPISTIAALPAQFPSVTGNPAEPPPAKLNASPSRSGKTAHRAPGRSGGNAGGRQGSGTAGGGGGLRAAGYVPPQFLVRYKPPYPEKARAERLEGTVLLLVSVNSAGGVAGAEVRRSCGHSLLDRAALQAVRSWRFEPARQNGVATAAQVEVPVRFRFG